MFSLMGNCVSCIKNRRKQKRSVTVAILGLDSAGKTTTTKVLLGESLETAPTIGFNKEDVTFANYEMTMYDLGGGRKIRDIWKDYLGELYAVIYVVDSAARDRLEEVQENLKILTGHEQIQGKPLLILANKQDLDNHMDEVDVMEGLDLENIVNTNRCPCRMEMCSAIKGTGRKMDVNIKTGMTWLCSMLDQMYEKLEVRVNKDMAVIEARREKEKEERKERVRKQREERERLAEEEKKKLGLDTGEVDDDDDDDDDDIVGGDPFRQLTAEDIQRKEEKLKRAKAKEKEKQRKLKALEGEEDSTNHNAAISGSTNPVDDIFRAPRSSRALLGLSNGGFSGGGHLAPLRDSSPRSERSFRSGDENDEFPNMPRSARQILPPLQSPIGTKFMNENGSGAKQTKKKNKKLRKQNNTQILEDTENNANDPNYLKSTLSYSRIQVEAKDDGSDSEQYSEKHERSRNSNSNKQLYVRSPDIMDRSPDSGRKKKGKKKTGATSDDEEGFDTLRLSQYMGDDRSERSTGGQGRYNESSPQLSQRQNGNTVNGHEDEFPERSTTPVKKLKKKKKNLLRKNKLGPSDEEFELSDVQDSPKKQLPWTMRSPDPKKMLEDADNHTNWGMADDLRGVEELEPVQRNRPNLDSEDDLML